VAHAAIARDATHKGGRRVVGRAARAAARDKTSHAERRAQVVGRAARTEEAGASGWAHDDASDVQSKAPTEEACVSRERAIASFNFN
jgi:hypothetical protein